MPARAPGHCHIQMHHGARLYFDAVNRDGGVFGQRIELRLLDDGYEPARCKANTERLIAEDVFALFGYVGTPTALAALPLMNQHRIPFFGPFTGAQALRDPFSRQVFHVRASYDDETALIVDPLVNLGLKRIAVLRQNDSYGQAGLDGVQRALAAIGLVERNTVGVAAKVFTEGLRRAGRGARREALIGALQSLQRFDVDGFRIHFGPRDHMASRFVELTLLTANGRVMR